MSSLVFDENDLRNLPFRECLDKCGDILKNENDESIRWDAVWLAGEVAEKSGPGTLFDEVADLFEWVLENDDNPVVKHEACFQIAARNMRKKIPVLIKSSLNDPTGLTKHEALEALGLMRAFEATDLIIKALKDPNPDVSSTAQFVLKRLKRLQKSKHEYTPSEIL